MWSASAHALHRLEEHTFGSRRDLKLSLLKSNSMCLSLRKVMDQFSILGQAQVKANQVVHLNAIAAYGSFGFNA